jgi:hypothetical protein
MPGFAVLPGAELVLGSVVVPDPAVVAEPLPVDMPVDELVVDVPVATDASTVLPLGEIACQTPPRSCPVTLSGFVSPPKRKRRRPP